MLSKTEENYLKAIYLIDREQRQTATTNAIASMMHTRAPSVTDMLKKLSKKSLINYTPYKPITLTDKGLTTALGIIRRNRLWKRFLVEKLHFTWDEIGDIAEELEHIGNDNLTAKLDELLNRPSTDVFGDPIPDSELHINYPSNVELSSLETNQFGMINGYRDTSPEFLRYLVKNGLTIGQTVNIKSKNSFDNSLEITVNMTRFVTISEKVASSILIKKLSR